MSGIELTRIMGGVNEDHVPGARAATDGDHLQALLDEVLDQGILFHGFTRYMRDYELVIAVSSDPRLSRPTGYRSYLFVNCVAAHVSSAVSPDTWAKSLSDELIAPVPDRRYDAFVWGVDWQPLWPGMTVVAESAAAERWTQDLGIAFHQVRIESNGHDIELVFSELRVTELGVGYTPFVIETDPTERGQDPRL